MQIEGKQNLSEVFQIEDEYSDEGEDETTDLRSNAVSNIRDFHSSGVLVTST